MNTIKLFGCSHQLSRVFALPRPKHLKVNGRIYRHYQVCVQCGERFAYDWEAMKIA